MYPWLKYGHFVGVGVLVVGMGLHVVAVERLWRTDRLPQFRELVTLAAIGVRVVIVGGAVLVAFGLALALQAWSLRVGWIVTALGLIGAQGLMGSVVSEPRLEALEHTLDEVAADADGDVREVLSATAAWPLRAAGRVSIANLLVLELLMTLKPEGTQLVAVIIATLAVTATLVVTARGHRPAGRGA